MNQARVAAWKVRPRPMPARVEAAAERVANDPNVQRIIERFEATIVPESVQPGEGD